MARKIDLPNLDDFVKRYESGVSVKDLASEAGCSQGPILRALIKAGVAIRGIRKALPDSEVVARYTGGESEKSIADSLGVSRNVIRRRLEEAGAHVRGQSEAESLKWATMKARPDYADLVERQCGAAHAATRGVPKSEASVVQAARTMFLKGIRRGRGGYRDEDRLGDALAVAGLKVERQFAVHRYNLDISLSADRIAIEVVSSPIRKAYAVTLRERTEYLLNAGWFVLFVDVIKGADRKPILWPAIIQQTLAHIDLARTRPTFHGRYRVIGRQGETVAAFRKYLDPLPRI